MHLYQGFTQWSYTFTSINSFPSEILSYFDQYKNDDLWLAFLIWIFFHLTMLPSNTKIHIEKLVDILHKLGLLNQECISVSSLFIFWPGIKPTKQSNYSLNLFYNCYNLKWIHIHQIHLPCNSLTIALAASSVLKFFQWRIRSITCLFVGSIPGGKLSILVNQEENCQHCVKPWY